MVGNDEALHVVGAVILHQNLLLACRRASHKADPGLWEFPGGKVELGESAEVALVREILEELGIVAIPRGRLDISDTPVNGRLIRLETLLCTVESAFEFKSNDHDAHLWLKSDELEQLNWAKPDLPAVQKLVAGDFGKLF